MRQLEILGEAARAIPPEVRVRAPDVAWTKMSGMRNVLVHGYFEIDTELVWDTVTCEVPALRVRMQALLADLESY